LTSSPRPPVQISLAAGGRATLGGCGPDVFGSGALAAEGDGAEGIAEAEHVCRSARASSGSAPPS
jgi:hypothetical protein